MPRGAAGPFAGATAKGAGTRVQWSEPEPWILAVLLVTGVAIVGRHPLARAIGTEVDDTAVTPSVVATAPPVPGSTSSAAPLAAAAAPTVTHAPRDPFRSLVSASGALLSPAAGAVSAGTTAVGQTHHAKATPPAHHSTPAAVASSTCAGTVHTVVGGDTLWTLAARLVKSGDVGKINVVWHRIYQANTPPLGSNPSLLPVGTKLCLPSKV